VVSVLVVVVSVVGIVSLVVLYSLDVLHLVLNMMVGEVVALSWRGETITVFLSWLLFPSSETGVVPSCWFLLW
jgi:hypothetical protein